MALLVQVLGVLALAAFVALLQGSGRPVPTTAGVAVVAVVVCGAIVWSDLYPAARDQLVQREANAALTEEDRRSLGGRFGNNREDFLMWVEKNVGPDERPHLYCGPGGEGCAGGYGEWITWRLSPRVFTPEPTPDEPIIVFGADPRQAPDARGRRFVGIEPRFGLLEPAR